MLEPYAKITIIAELTDAIFGIDPVELVDSVIVRK